MPRFFNPHNFLLKMFFRISLGKASKKSNSSKVSKLYKFATSGNFKNVIFVIVKFCFAK